MKTINFKILAFFLFAGVNTFAQNTGISDVAHTPATSAVLDIYSTSKGMLTPRLTLAQRTAINNPATGLLVYQTDGVSGFYYYNGTTWTILSSGTIQWQGTTNGIYYNSGLAGVGINNPSSRLTVKDTIEIRRVGAMSQLLFSNTAGSGDFRIGGDGGDIFWQGGGGRNLQMGSYWGTILTGDRQTTTAMPFSSGTSGIGVLVKSSRDQSIPLGIMQNSSTQSANLTEWRNASGTPLSVVTNNGSFGIGTSTFDSTNPEKLLVDMGVTNSVNAIYAKGSINSYLQMNIRNTSSGTQSSSDIVATANNGTETTNFIDLGINGSGYVYQSGNPIETGAANDGYLISSGNDFYLVNNNSSKNLIFLVGGTATTNEAMRITPTERIGIGTTSPQAKLDVSGNFKLGASGSVLNGMIKTNVTITDLSLFNYTSTKQITVTVTGATVNGSVILNPRSALPAGLGIAWAYVSSANTVTIGFTNTDSSLKFIGSVVFDVTVIQ